jgi:hypothetical protein
MLIGDINKIYRLKGNNWSRRRRGREGSSHACQDNVLIKEK